MPSSRHFKVLTTCPDSQARTGLLQTAHGSIPTPIFMPVGTQGSVKATTPEELINIVNAQIILANTYHLFVRPGHEVIAQMGGLHQFTCWERPILTDSGGFQVFSLAKLRTIKEEGVHFANHLNGAATFISPEKSMEIQATLGSDIAMLFDECPPYPCEESYAKNSLERTTRWAQRCKQWHTDHAEALLPWQGKQQLFGIVQGSTYPHLRKESAQQLVSMDFDGYAVGGIAVGEPENAMLEAIEHTTPFLPKDKPRYAMGLGTPPQMLAMIARGIDMFDCVMPTRLARHGVAFTLDGPITIKNKVFELDNRPLCENTHPALLPYSRSFIRHLFRSQEILSLRLLSLHNLFFFLSLLSQARAAIQQGHFPQFQRTFTQRYLAS